METIINLKDFSEYPGYRYKEDSPGSSGEEFRDQCLLPALNNNEQIVVNLEGVKKRILPSFLSEAFAELAIMQKWKTLSDFEEHITIISEARYIDDIKEYVNMAQKNMLSMVN